MNLGINKQEVEFLEQTILYFIRQSKYPNMLIDIPGVNVKNILAQLQYIKRLGEDYSEEIRAREAIYGSNSNN
jgi:hypothetical protein